MNFYWSIECFSSFKITKLEEFIDVTCRYRDYFHEKSICVSISYANKYGAYKHCESWKPRLMKKMGNKEEQEYNQVYRLTAYVALGVLQSSGGVLCWKVNDESFDNHFRAPLEQVEAQSAATPIICLLYQRKEVISS